MNAARKCGARGGTVLRGRGTANPEAESLFGIAIQPEKEIVMILVKKSLKNDILHALYKAVGLDTPGQGIAFTMPVESVVGLTVTDGIPTEDGKPKEDAKSTKKVNNS
ncbi:MAG: P-II family nitrogen regulator [Clostridia bacterium]|nr:P-II family nitrogen regulator [Clostridia bacterium]